MTNGVPHGSVLGLVLFIILTSDVDSGIECSIIKFADDPKLNGAVDRSEGRDAMQREPG